MALKSIGTELQSYIPKCEQGNTVDPFTVFYKPMNKRTFDAYVDKLNEIVKGRVISHSDKSGEILFDTCLAENSDGVILKNCSAANGNFDITEKKLAVQFLLSLPVEIGNEIDRVMRGASVLDETESKNSVGQ
jgi:hypothetical protein